MLILEPLVLSSFRERKLYGRLLKCGGIYKKNARQTDEHLKFSMDD